MVKVVTPELGSGPLGDKCERAIDHFVDIGFVPQNAIEIELCLRITNGKPALAHWIGEGETEFG